MPKSLPSIALVLTTACAIPVMAGYPVSDHPMFDGDAVHDVYLTFAQPDWWNQLRTNFEGQSDPLYLEAEFDWGSVHFDSIGVRFKGGSSYNSYPGDKKSFNLHFSEYVPGQKLDGIDILNVNNGFKDPSFVREKVAFELCDAVGLPSQRANFAKLYLNGTYWGLYTIVEQVDKEFVLGRFGAAEDGNLWKGDPRGTLAYLGPDPVSYQNDYDLKTNETANDWTALVELIDGLNNTPVATLPAALDPLLDVNSALELLAVDVLTANLDSYFGSGHNYFLYHRDLNGLFLFANHDLNEMWGCFNMGMTVAQLMNLDPFWTPPSSRPLATQLFQVPGYREVYKGHMRRLMAIAADPDTILARMDTLRDLVRPAVYADSKKMYTDQQFEDAMMSDTGGGPGGLSPGLDPFIRGRHSFLTSQLGSWTPISGLVINEVMASNATTLPDELGDYDDWIEIANVGSQPVSLGGLALTDDLSDITSFVFPAMTLGPGQFTIVWADAEPTEGNRHAPFKLNAGGDNLYLLDGNVVLDDVSFGNQRADVSLGRCPDGGETWQFFAGATPAAANGPCVSSASYLVGEGIGAPNPNRVRVYSAAGQPTPVDLYAYAAGKWGVNVSAGDLDGGGVDEMLTGPGPGDVFGPQVRGFKNDGTALAKLNYYAYGTLKFGVNVAAGLVDADGYDEVVTGPGPGTVFGPHVRAFDFDGSAVGAIAKVNFFAYSTLKYGVNVSSGDLDADVYHEIVTGPGPGAIFGAQVRGFNFDGNVVSAMQKINFNAYASTYGVQVAGLDADTDGAAEMATAPGAGATNVAQFLGYDYDLGAIVAMAGFDKTPYPTLFGGRVGRGDLTGDGRDELVTGAGPDPTADSTVKAYAYDGGDLNKLAGDFVPFASDLYGVNATAATLGY